MFLKLRSWIVLVLGLLNYFQPLICLSSQFKGVESFESLSGTLNSKFTQTVEVHLRRRESVFNNQAHANITGIVDLYIENTFFFNIQRFARAALIFSGH